MHSKTIDLAEIQKMNRMIANPSEIEGGPQNSKTITLDNGNIYCGEVDEEGAPHGDNGREFCEDGSIYYGSFRKGKWHGIGYIVNINLDMIQKEYIDGKMCGI